MTKISVGTLCVIVPMLLALGGCTVKKCKGDECDFGFDDAGSSNTGGDDDAGSEDAGESDVDAGGNAGDAGDGGSDDAGTGGDAGAALTLDEFCSFQLSTALAWRDSFENCCDTADFSDADRETFLLYTFALAADGLSSCEVDRQAQIDTETVTYDGTQAQACADAFAAQFMAPDLSCPATGFDREAIRAAQGHGTSVLVQIPACRETFVGTLAKDDPCTDSFECADGLRCLTVSGSGASANNACKDAVAEGDTCIRSGDCDDGLTCVGSSASGRVCRLNDDLGLNGAKCQLDRECAEGLVCASGSCSEPIEDLVCIQ